MKDFVELTQILCLQNMFDHLFIPCFRGRNMSNFFWNVGHAPKKACFLALFRKKQLLSEPISSFLSNMSKISASAGYSVPSRNHPRILSPRLLPIPFGLSVPRLSCSLASPLLNPLRIHFTICSHVSLAAQAAHPSGCAACASSLLTNRESYGIL